MVQTNTYCDSLKHEQGLWTQTATAMTYRILLACSTLFLTAAVQGQNGGKIFSLSFRCKKAFYVMFLCDIIDVWADLCVPKAMFLYYAGHI